MSEQIREASRRPAPEAVGRSVGFSEVVGVLNERKFKIFIIPSRYVNYGGYYEALVA